jgi:hypothetical protein
VADKTERIGDLILVLFLEREDGVKGLVSVLEIGLNIFISLLLCFELLRMEEL